MFILSAFADRQYWPSCLEPLLYPTGCSFYRPFSYREGYLAESLRNELKDPARREKFLSDADRNKGIFGIRFKDESEPQYRGVFIPLREIKLTNVQFSDSFQLSFKVDQYVKLTPQGTLHSIGLRGIVDYEEPENTLLFEIPDDETEAFSAFSYQADLPSHLWDKLADDESLSQIARGNFIGTLLLRLIRVSERGEPAALTPTSLEPKLQHPVYGFKLETGRAYDLDLAYHRILAAGESLPAHLATLPKEMPYDFAFKSPPEHFDIAQDRLPITGNYRRQAIWVEPKVGRPGSIFLDWIGVKKTDKDSMADPKIDKVLPLHVPVISLAKNWPAERIVYAVVVGISFVGALICSYLAYRVGTQLKPASGQAATQTSSPVVPLLTAMAAFFGATFFGYLKDLIKGER